MKNGWIGVDFDGTLVKDTAPGEIYHPGNLGPPIPTMVERVKGWLAKGITVKIFTARVADDPKGIARDLIKVWCLEHLGQVLDITNCKDYACFAIWDDRAVTVEKDTGRPLAPFKLHEKE